MIASLLKLLPNFMFLRAFRHFKYKSIARFETELILSIIYFSLTQCPFRTEIFDFTPCRAKRKIAEYDYIWGVTENDTQELVDFVKEFKDEVETRLEKEHPEFE
jgi:hypothetical protein